MPLLSISRMRAAVTLFFKKFFRRFSPHFCSPFCSYLDSALHLLMLGLMASMAWTMPAITFDEALKLQVASEMKASGQFFSPTWDGNPVYDELPTLTWLRIAASVVPELLNLSAPQGVSARAARLVSFAFFAAWIGLLFFARKQALPSHAKQERQTSGAIFTQGTFFLPFTLVLSALMPVFLGVQISQASALLFFATALTLGLKNLLPQSLSHSGSQSDNQANTRQSTIGPSMSPSAASLLAGVGLAGVCVVDRPSWVFTCVLFVTGECLRRGIVSAFTEQGQRREHRHHSQHVNLLKQACDYSIHEFTGMWRACRNAALIGTLGAGLFYACVFWNAPSPYAFTYLVELQWNARAARWHEGHLSTAWGIGIFLVGGGLLLPYAFFKPKPPWVWVWLGILAWPVVYSQDKELAHTSALWGVLALSAVGWTEDSFQKGGALWRLFERVRQILQAMLGGIMLVLALVVCIASVRIETIVRSQVLPYKLQALLQATPPWPWELAALPFIGGLGIAMCGVSLLSWLPPSKANYNGGTNFGGGNFSGRRPFVLMPKVGMAITAVMVFLFFDRVVPFAHQSADAPLARLAQLANKRAAPNDIFATSGLLSPEASLAFGADRLHQYPRGDATPFEIAPVPISGDTSRDIAGNARGTTWVLLPVWQRADCQASTRVILAQDGWLLLCASR